MPSPRLLVPLVLLMAALRSSLAAAAEPATRPSVDQLLEHLADPDPSARDVARDALMSLSAGDLPNLRQASEQLQPLHPNQVVVLRQVVQHIFLVSHPVPSVPDKGFLGVQMRDQPVRLPDGRELPRAVVIMRRYAGFDAFRALADADIVLDINREPITGMEHFRQRIMALLPGDVIHMTVARGDRVVPVTVRVGARPKVEDEFQFNQEFDARMQEQIDLADEYWNREFGKIAEAQVS